MHDNKNLFQVYSSRILLPKVEIFFFFFLRGKTRHPALRRKSTGFRGISTNHLDEIKMPPERGERRFVLQGRDIRAKEEFQR